MVYYPGYLLWVFWDGKSLVPCLGSRVCACWYLYSTVEDGESAGNVVWPVDTTTQMNYMNSDGWFIDVLFCHFHELILYMLHKILFFRILCYSDSTVTIVNLVFVFWFQLFSVEHLFRSPIPEVHSNSRRCLDAVHGHFEETIPIRIHVSHVYSDIL